MTTNTPSQPPQPRKNDTRASEGDGNDVMNESKHQNDNTTLTQLRKALPTCWSLHITDRIGRDGEVIVWGLRAAYSPLDTGTTITIDIKASSRIEAVDRLEEAIDTWEC